MQQKVKVLPISPNKKAIWHIGRWFGQPGNPGRVWRIFTRHRRPASSWGAKPRWGEPTRIPSVGEHPGLRGQTTLTADGRFFRTYTVHICMQIGRCFRRFVVSFVFCFRIALRFKAWEVRASNEARRWLHHLSVSWIRLWQVLGGFELIGVSSWRFLSAWWLWFCFWLFNWLLLLLLLLLVVFN